MEACLKMIPSDDEEDLDALRLAALQTIKKKNNIGYPKNGTPTEMYSYKGHSRGGKRRFFPGQSCRNNRNGQFNISVRSTNLISIPTTEQSTELTNISSKSSITEAPKLVLPQDRYSNKTVTDDKSEGLSSKFDRYDNSNSESEEDESEITECEAKLERSDSLEAIMKELEEEIQGESKIKEKKISKTKRKSKLKNVKSEPVEQLENPISIKQSVESEVIVHKVPNTVDSGNKLVDNTEEVEDANQNSQSGRSSPRLFVRTDLGYSVKNSAAARSPNNRRQQINKRNNRKFNNYVNDTSFTPLINSVVPNVPFVTQPPPFTTVYNAVPTFITGDVLPMTTVPPPSLYGHPNISVPPTDVPPPTFFPLPSNTRPLSPLAVNPDSLHVIPLGPLSPRSAAFVLQNRAIVEKRKRSPRRSYSRSPSSSPPRSRYSKSPRRSLSPLRRSLTPRRTPTRRSLSPIRRIHERSPKRTRDFNRPPLRDRLGLRNRPEVVDEKDKKPESEPASKVVESPPVDMVLEARKRKFQRKEINIKEGVIRLKPKEDFPIINKPEMLDSFEEKMDEDKLDDSRSLSLSLNEIDEDLLLKDDEELELEAKIDELFTDEDTDHENEGRFKIKHSSIKRPPMVPLSRINGDKPISSVKRVTPVEPSRTENKHTNRTDVKRSEEHKNLPKSETYLKPSVKSRLLSKVEKREPLTHPIEARKIEIKIRNPSKYDKESKLNLKKIVGDEILSRTVSTIRKVEIAKKENSGSDDDDMEPEIIVENDDDDDEDVTVCNEGDLRAQLSRKRAERQHKNPIIDSVPSRLLQNALEGAVFKKRKSKKKEKDIVKKEVKLPIHLRLGIAHDTDIFADTKIRKKSKKRKNRNLEQV